MKVTFLLPAELKRGGQVESLQNIWKAYVTGHEDEKTLLNHYCFDQKDVSDKELGLEQAANKRMII